MNFREQAPTIPTADEVLAKFTHTIPEDEIEATRAKIEEAIRDGFTEFETLPTTEGVGTKGKEIVENSDRERDMVTVVAGHGGTNAENEYFTLFAKKPKPIVDLMK